MSWIKIRTNLTNDPRVLFVAARLALHRHQVTGMLVELWSYADAHSTSGLLRLVSVASVNQLVGVDGFAEALKEVGWLDYDPDGVLLPRFGEHNGSTAKARAQAATRVAAHRSRNGGTVTRAQPREEESRGEEKKRRARGRGKGGDGWI